MPIGAVSFSSSDLGVSPVLRETNTELQVTLYHAGSHTHVGICAGGEEGGTWRMKLAGQQGYLATSLHYFHLSKSDLFLILETS